MVSTCKWPWNFSVFHRQIIWQCHGFHSIKNYRNVYSFNFIYTRAISNIWRYQVCPWLERPYKSTTSNARFKVRSWNSWPRGVRRVALFYDSTSSGETQLVTISWIWSINMCFFSNVWGWITKHLNTNVNIWPTYHWPLVGGLEFGTPFYFSIYWE